jgi:lysophospholipase L1-like esterase
LRSAALLVAAMLSASTLSASAGELRYLALGDSYTIGESVSESARWPVQLAQRLRADGFAVAPPRLIATTGWTTDELSAAMDAAGPLGEWDLVSLLIGVNDQYRGRDPEAFRTGFVALLERAIRLARGEARRVVVLTIPDWGVTPFGAASGRDRSAIARALDGYNTIVAEEARRRGVAPVDIVPVSRARGAEWVAEDGLHPSAALYKAWTALALPPVRGLLERVGVAQADPES